MNARPSIFNYLAMNDTPSYLLLRRSFRGTRGQTLVEYALIIAFISVVAISSLIAMGSQVSGAYTTIDRQLNDAQNGGAAAAARTH